MASALTDAARGLSDVRWYCPNPHAYAYVVLHTRNCRIFAIAYGMTALAYRLGSDQIAGALADSGSVCTDIGQDGVLFPPWGSVGKNPTTPGLLERWCKRAHDHILSLKA